jgi:N-acetylneuraminic acid mutarotase
MPTARFWFSACAVDGKIYVIGGARSVTGKYLPTVEEYDPATDTWRQKTNMPTARDGHAASVVNGKIYVIGGEPSAQASIPTLEAYDPATDTWTQKANMPTRRTFACAAAVNGKLYVISGVRAGKPADPTWDTQADPVEATSAVEEYDPATDTWARKANIPTRRDGAAAALVNGRIYVIGGTAALHNPPTPVVEEYDPATDTWTKKASMPTARMFPSAAVQGGRIYVMGGGVWNAAIFSTVQMYDPTTDTWATHPPMNAQRWGLASGAANGRIYAIGGSGVWYPGAGMNTVEEYDPKPTVSLLRTGSALKVYWNGILESSDTVNGPNWQALNPATWPYTTGRAQAGPMKFYRARQP